MVLSFSELHLSLRNLFGLRPTRKQWYNAWKKAILRLTEQNQNDYRFKRELGDAKSIERQWWEEYHLKVMCIKLKNDLEILRIKGGLLVDNMPTFINTLTDEEKRAARRMSHPKGDENFKVPGGLYY